VNLQHSKYYHIKLYDPWNLEYDGYIVGTVNKTTISTIDNFDIRSTYFTDYNLGLATYLSTVTDTTPIYIINLIENKSPVNVGEENIYIPETLIDFNKTYQYLIGSIPSYNITINPKYFKSTLQENNYSKLSNNAIVKALNSVEPFVADTISVAYSSTSALITQDILDKYNRDTKEQLEYIKLAKLQTRTNDETRLSELYLKKEEFERAKVDYENKVDEYNVLIGEIAIAQVEINRENQILSGIRNVMIEIIDQIKTEQISVTDFPSFYEIYESVKQSM